MVKRCLGALEEPPVVEALSFLDLTERDRFLLNGPSIVSDQHDTSPARVYAIPRCEL